MKKVIKCDVDGNDFIRAISRRDNENGKFISVEIFFKDILRGVVLDKEKAEELIKQLKEVIEEVYPQEDNKEKEVIAIIEDDKGSNEKVVSLGKTIDVPPPETSNRHFNKFMEHFSESVKKEMEEMIKPEIKTEKCSLEETFSKLRRESKNFKPDSQRRKILQMRIDTLRKLIKIKNKEKVEELKSEMIKKTLELTLKYVSLGSGCGDRKEAADTRHKIEVLKSTIESIDKYNTTNESDEQWSYASPFWFSI